MDTQRRSLMLGAVSTLALGLPAPGWAQSPPVSLDAFIQLSATLCNRPAATLDRGMAQRILQALQAQGKSSRLPALQQDAQADAPLASELRSIWLSGLMDTGAGAIVVGFTQALTWGSAPFLHAPGSCGGPTGYWSDPPPAHPA
ncbi:MAG: hypothetical protein WBF69_06515 [Castellaniella sp.]|uniref:hypothetical protein n=1 Tax=Castellaniella sp. TaxID=1955812 RepID=UPI003C714522